MSPDPIGPTGPTPVLPSTPLPPIVATPTPPPQTTGDTGVVTTHVIQLPGMVSGHVGDSGLDKPGATIRTIAIPAWQYIGVEVLWNFLRVFFGLLTVDGLGLADLAPAGDAMSHIWNVAGIALVPTALSLGQELYAYLSKIRESRH